jgi:chromosome segregation ATPase
MDSVSIPYLPVSLWILAGATTILILLAAFGFYIYWRKWIPVITGEGADVASLTARKQILEKDVEALREWIEVRKAELERLVAEREEQERLRAVLADLEHQCAVKNQENQGLRNEVGELENRRHQLTQILEKMQHEIGDLETKRAESQSLDSQLADLRSRLE